MAVDIDEGFILDLSDNSISPMSSPMRSDYDDVEEDYRPEQRIPDPEEDPNEEVVFYIQNGIEIGKWPDGKPMYRYDDLGGLEGKAIAEELRLANATKRPAFMPLPAGQRFKELTMDQFRYALRVYENNQMMSLHDVDFLNELENWFIQVIEPKPAPRWKGKLRGTEILEYNQDIEDWIKRETTKLKGYSAFCDHDVRKKIKPNPDTLKLVKAYIDKLNAMKNTGKFSCRR